MIRLWVFLARCCGRGRSLVLPAINAVVFTDVYQAASERLPCGSAGSKPNELRALRGLLVVPCRPRRRTVHESHRCEVSFSIKNGVNPDFNMVPFEDKPRRPVVTRAVICVALLTVGSACRSAPVAEPYTPGLGEIMTLQQMRHSKLWWADTPRTGTLPRTKSKSSARVLTTSLPTIPHTRNHRSPRRTPFRG